MIKRYWQVQEISSLVQAEIQLNIPRLVWESTYVTWIEIDFVNIPPCTSLYVLHWFLKESFDSFLKLMCPIFPRRIVGTKVRCVRTITSGSCGLRALRSMMTGRCLTHQQLATWRIATFSEIVSHQYVIAYDTRPHEWSYQPWILAKKKLSRKKIAAQNWGVIWMSG